MFRWLHTVDYRLSIFFHRIRPNLYWLCTLLAIAVGLTLLNYFFSEIKPISDWSWIDILGEGATALFLGVWLCIVLASRPKGRTTSWLAFGLLGVFASCYQDVLDEFFKLHGEHYWDSLLESLPIGLLALTVGMLLWYREQTEVQKYLHKRARIFHNVSHRLHGETSLPQTPHLKQALLSEKEQVLIFLEIVPNRKPDESSLSRSEYGKLRSIVADTILWNLPDKSRVFHVVGNQYAVLVDIEPNAVPTLTDNNINELVHGLIRALRSLRYFPEASYSAIDMTILHSTLRVSGSVAEKDVSKIIKQTQMALMEAVPSNSDSNSLVSPY